MNKQLRRFFGRNEEEGQALILFAILMLALLFAVGLAVDAGQLYAAKRTEQEAADAAAFAGAVVIYQSAAPCNAACVSAAISAARTDANTNGYSGACAVTTPGVCTNAATLTTVEVNFPPLSGVYVGDMRHVEVIITRQVKTALVPAEAVFNPVRARGVAGAEPLQNNYAIMALDRGNTEQAFYAQDQADVHLNGGGILVNSTDGNAAENGQSTASRFTVQSPYTLDVTGQATGSWFSIPVNSGHAQVADPFAGFPKPSTAGPDGIGGTADDLPICNSLAACQDGSGKQIPGVYDVKLGGSGNTNLSLNPGIYILRKGADTAGNADVIGSNVFLYNTYSTYPAAPGASPSCTSVNLQGNSTFTITAQTTGTWANMLLYQDPACSVEMKIGGNGTFIGTGSVYVPNGPFRFAGQNATLIGSQLIAQTVWVQEGNITINYNPSTTAQPILPRLAE
jgi:Flp pilus assembly protein TadG